ncbi:MAG: hypothetical protein AAFQ92_24085 [Bacteroidota bacterium]
MNSLEAIFQKVELIKEAGHIVLIKFDGERKEEKVTVVLNYLKDGKSSVFQRHGDDLLTLLRKLLEDYSQVDNNALM